jgi:enoyl-CoA hydratase/carnithine racemase
MADLTVTEPIPGVQQLTMDRPERLNALSWGLVDALHDALDALAEDNATRVVVLTGAGRGFCSGLDLVEAATTGSKTSEGLRGVSGGLRTQEHIAALIPKMRNLRQPIIAAVNGPAFGGGLALALASDIRLAGASASFGVQFSRLGLSGCDIGVSYLLPRLVGSGRAFELLLTGRRFEVDEADRIGLLSAVVPDDQLLDEALAKAQLLLANAPLGVVLTKQAMWVNVDAPSLEAAIQLENRNQILASQTGDLAEAAAAFMEKRDPVWT